MKKIIIGSIITAGIFLAGNAQAKYIGKGTEENLIKICEAIQSNSKIKLLIAIRNSGISSKAISEGLVCNGYDPVTFAIVSNADNTGKYMASRAKVDYDALLAKL